MIRALALAYLECAKRKVFSRCCFILLFFFPCPFPVVSIVTGFKYLVDAVVVMRAVEDSIGCTPTCSSSAVYYIEMNSIQPDKSNPWHLSWRYHGGGSALNIESILNSKQHSFIQYVNEKVPSVSTQENRANVPSLTASIGTWLCSEYHLGRLYIVQLRKRPK